MKRRKLLMMFPALLLNSLLMNYPVSAEQPIAASGVLTESGARLWSESEVDELIDALTVAAHEAIEAAAGEAAKAAAIASLQSQAAALASAARWERKYNETKKDNVKNIVIASLSCFVIGAVTGGAILFIRGK